jgi:trk system potassium uptake protein TrkH
MRRFFRVRVLNHPPLENQSPIHFSLQSKVVIFVSAGLIIAGAAAIMLFEHYVGQGSSDSGGILGALFQSVTARTAGFNTVDIDKLSTPGQFILILLMFIGGSPGSAAGGIKTVTFAVLLMTVVTAPRKRGEVEMFKRSIRVIIVGRAVTIVLLFVMVLFTASLALTITERSSGWPMSKIFFETASALGTVGLTTGITPSLTTAGKLIIIVVMLIGRLGPLTLLAALTFNIKPARYNYPDESLIVG